MAGASATSTTPAHCAHLGVFHESIEVGFCLQQDGSLLRDIKKFLVIFFGAFLLDLLHGVRVLFLGVADLHLQLTELPVDVNAQCALDVFLKISGSDLNTCASVSAREGDCFTVLCNCGSASMPGARRGQMDDKHDSPLHSDVNG